MPGHNAFHHTVWEYYWDYGRHNLPWRQPESDGSFDPYKILVSELMLQQTQVSRVIPKYLSFLKLFPDLSSLVAAELGDVLRAWRGLGYNRRAKYLWQAAQTIVQDYDGELPTNLEALTTLPGVGPNTAGAIVAYAFNQPVVFIETNIRTVIIHHFYHDGEAIPDKQIREIVQFTLDVKRPREWYWALMDYGSHLKQTVGNLNVRSKSYAKQSPFEGSKRQLRGHILRLLGEQARSSGDIKEQVRDPRVTEVLEDLTREGLIKQHDNTYSL